MSQKVVEHSKGLRAVAAEKVHGRRVGVLNPDFSDELAAHLARTGRKAPSDLVLQATNGGPVRAANFRLRVYGPAVRAIGLEGVTFHRLRHSAGHIMRTAGVPLEVIQRRLGHASIRTTADVYGSLPESVDRAVADQLDQLFRPDGGAASRQDEGSAGGP